MTMLAAPLACPPLPHAAPLACRHSRSPPLSPAATPLAATLACRHSRSPPTPARRHFRVPALGCESGRCLDQLAEHGLERLLLPGLGEGSVLGEGLIGLGEGELVGDHVGEELAQRVA